MTVTFPPTFPPAYRRATCEPRYGPRVVDLHVKVKRHEPARARLLGKLDQPLVPGSVVGAVPQRQRLPVPALPDRVSDQAELTPRRARAQTP